MNTRFVPRSGLKAYENAARFTNGRFDEAALLRRPLIWMAAKSRDRRTASPNGRVPTALPHDRSGSRLGSATQTLVV